jgi:hypothetical protein
MPPTPPTTAVPTIGIDPTPASTTQSRSKSSAASSKNKGDWELKRLLEANRSDWAEQENKRRNIEAETQIEVARLQAESQERIVEQMQREMRREDRESQREREERQIQMFQGMMSTMIQIVNSKSQMKRLLIPECREPWPLVERLASQYRH